MAVVLVPRWLYFPAPQVAACYKTSRGSASQTLLALGGRELGAEPDVSGGINTWNHSDSVPIQNRLTERQEESCVDSPLFVNCAELIVGCLWTVLTAHWSWIYL